MATITQFSSTLFTGSAPAKPDGLGDIYLEQDRIRDFAWVWDRVGALAADIAAAPAFLMAGGSVVQGADVSHVNIAAAVGYAPWTITLGVDGANPPTSGSEDVQAVRIASTAQSALALTGISTGTVYKQGVSESQVQTNATLDGSTVNYVKLEYAESLGLQRTRLRAGGSYYFTRAPSFRLTIDPTTPTAYQMVLATLVGNGSSILVISQYYPPAGTMVKMPVASGYSVAAGNLVEIADGGGVKKFRRASASLQTFAPGVSTPYSTAIIPLDATHAVIVYPNSGTTYAARVVTVDSDLVVSIGSEQSLYTVTSTSILQPLRGVALSATSVLLIFQMSNTFSQVKAAVLSISGNTITANAAVNCPDATGMGSSISRISSTQAFVTWCRLAASNYYHSACVISVSGTTPAWNTQANSATLGTSASSDQHGFMQDDAAWGYCSTVIGSNVNVSAFTISGTTVTFSASSGNATATNFRFLYLGGANMLGLIGTTFVRNTGWSKSAVPPASWTVGLPHMLGAAFYSQDRAVPIGPNMIAGAISANSSFAWVQLALFAIDGGHPSKHCIYQFPTPAGGGYMGCVAPLTDDTLLMAYDSNTNVITVTGFRLRSRVVGIAVDANGTVVTQGVASGLSLTPNALYYMDDAGALTTVETGHYVGKALNAAQLMVAMRPGI